MRVPPGCPRLRAWPREPTGSSGLTNLVLALLQTSRPLSLREIGGQVAGYPAQASAIRQAFERDKRTLRDSGIPITVERVGGDEQFGYRIRPEDYYLPELDLTEDERSTLVLRRWSRST